MDVFWVGEFSLVDAQTWGRDKTNRFVITVAKLCGCGKDDLAGCIKYLEKQYPIPSDKLTPEWGGGLQHHLRDFAHHASLGGLFFSILSQFTGSSYGTDRDGLFKIIPFKDSSLIGQSFEEKLFNGVVVWAMHLVSDMAGSSSSVGRGTGIPGPILSLAKQMSVLPGIRDLLIAYKGDDIGISVWISKVFNGTAFPHESYHDVTRFDLRTEIGVYAISTKQKIPVVIYQCLIRAFYFVRRLVLNISKNEIKRLSDLRKLHIRDCLPFNNKCITRMSTIASGVFVAIDTGDAVIRGSLLGSKDKVVVATKILVRLNFSGIANFIVSIKNELFQPKAANHLVQYEPQSGDEMKDDTDLSIEIDIEIDNASIYRYTFSQMYLVISDIKRKFIEHSESSKKLLSPLYFTCDQNVHLLSTISRRSIHPILIHTELLIMRLMSQNNISFEAFSDNSMYSLHMPFYRIENGKRTAYMFVLGSFCRDDLDTIRKEKQIDDFKIVQLVEIHDPDMWSRLYSYEEKRFGGLVQFCTIKDVFDLIGYDEYLEYKRYVDCYNNAVRTLLGYPPQQGYMPDKDIEGVFLNCKENTSQGELTYTKLAEWLDNQLCGDPLIQKDIPIHLSLARFGSTGAKEWRLTLTTITGFEDGRFPINTNYPNINDELCWTSDSSDDEVDTLIIGMINEYLQRGKYNSLLKSHNQVSVGFLGNPHILFSKS